MSEFPIRRRDVCRTVPLAALGLAGTTETVGATTGRSQVAVPGGAVRTLDTGGYEQGAKLAAADGDPADRFGVEVSLSADGETALVGAIRDEDPNGFRAGSAYVFERREEGWSQAAKLAPDDGDPWDFFGASVALSGDGTTALVGASKDEDPNGATDGGINGAGSAYVFERSGGAWSQRAKLAPDDGDPEDGFGASVALSGDGRTALIGARDDDEPEEPNAGSAYVFERSGGAWSQRAKLAPDDGDSADLFGTSVALTEDGRRALIGASEDEDPNGFRAGSAYVFQRSGDAWSQAAKLAPDDGDPKDRFGGSVALSRDGTTALVGAWNDEDPNGRAGGDLTGAGSAYVFQRSGDAWSQAAKLAPDDGDIGDRFGGSVALTADGTTALVGAIRDEDPNGFRAGSAYVFRRSEEEWSQGVKLAPDDGDPDDRFGGAVALSGDGTTALIGAWNDEDPNGAGVSDLTGAGSAYVFQRSRGGGSDPIAKYTDADGVVTTSGLQRAVSDWSGGELSTEMLQRVVAAWSSGDPVS